MHGEVMPVNRSGDRIDEKRHIVVDHFNERECRRIPVFFFGGVVDARQRLASLACGAEIEMVDRNLRHDCLGAPFEILVGYVGKVLFEKAP